VTVTGFYNSFCTLIMLLIFSYWKRLFSVSVLNAIWIVVWISVHLTEMWLHFSLVTIFYCRLPHTSKILRMREKIERDLLQFVTSRDVIYKFCMQRKSQFFDKLVIMSISIICSTDFFTKYIRYIYLDFILFKVKTKLCSADLQNYSQYLKKVQCIW